MAQSPPWGLIDMKNVCPDLLPHSFPSERINPQRNVLPIFICSCSRRDVAVRAIYSIETLFLVIRITFHIFIAGIA